MSLLCFMSPRQLTVSQQQQLSLAQKQASGLEVTNNQFQVQLHTLLQTKEVLTGETLFLTMDPRENTGLN